MSNTHIINKKGMLFDLDGVLVDSEGEYSKFWGGMGDRYGLAPTFAADIKGTFNRIWLVNLVETLISLGVTSDCAGTRRTSSKVNPSFPNFASNSETAIPATSYIFFTLFLFTSLLFLLL